MNHRAFRYISNCPIVSGYRRACVYDLPRRVYEVVPLAFSEMMRSIDGSIDWEIWIAGQSDPVVAQQYLEHALSSEYAVLIEPSLSEGFIGMDYEWRAPAQITNAVVDIDRSSVWGPSQVQALRSVQCHYVQFRILERVEDLKVVEILNSFDRSHVDHIQLLLPGSYADDRDWMQTLLDQFPRLNSIRVYGVPQTSERYSDAIMRPIIWMGGSLDEYGPAKERMVITMTLFCESQEHHNYFNRKLYIAKDGAIGNAPESTGHYGNMNEIRDGQDMIDIVECPDFQKYWRVSKKMIDVCKECEFRYMCMDNRIPESRSLETWFHEKECPYNPYICKWKGEEGYRTLAECGVVSNAKGFSIDHERIAAINAELWGE